MQGINSFLMYFLVFDFIMPLPDKFLVGAHVSVRDSLIVCHTPILKKSNWNTLVTTNLVGVQRLGRAAMRKRFTFPHGVVQTVKKKRKEKKGLQKQKHLALCRSRTTTICIMPSYTLSYEKRRLLRVNDNYFIDQRIKKCSTLLRVGYQNFMFMGCADVDTSCAMKVKVAKDVPSYFLVKLFSRIPQTTWFFL